MNDTIYHWFTVGPARYWLIAGPVGMVFIAAALLPRRFPTWSFLLILAICLLGFRWPIIVAGGEASVDESQIIAGAITLKEAPVFWRDVDAHAIGPAAIYPLTLLGMLGAPLDYETARLLAVFLGWAGMAASYLLLREYFGEAWARVGVVPATSFLALTRHWDLAHYSAETVALPLIGIGAAGAFIGIKRGSHWITFVGGGFLAATAWAKLQAVPIALVIFLGAIAGVLRGWPGDGVRRRKLLLGLAGGGLACLALPLAAIAIAGAWRDFSISYLRTGVDYLGQSQLGRLDTLWDFVTYAETGFPAFVWPLVIAIGVGGFTTLRGPSGNRVLAGTLALAAVAAVIVVAAPARPYPHYLELVVLPLGLAAAACAARLPATWFIALTVLPQVAVCLSPRTYKFDFPPGANHLVLSDTAKIIKANATTGASLTVWGWEPQLYVMTGLPQATREAHTERQLRQSAYRDYYRARFLEDFRVSPPTFFVDAITPDHIAFLDRRVDGIATWPELGMLIGMDYQIVGSADGRRVYRRIQR